MGRVEKKKNEKDGDTKRFELDCNIRSIEGEGNERRYELSFSSEEPCVRWWGVEILNHTPESVDLTRLNTIGCVLYNHDRNKVIGKVLSAWVDGNRGKAVIEFDSDEESELIYQKVKSGTLKGVSVGYAVQAWEEVLAGKKSLDGRFTGPCEIAKRWIPHEISIVSVPADATVGVGRAKETLESEEAKKGINSFYYYEKQFQINKNLKNTGGRNYES